MTRVQAVAAPLACGTLLLGLVLFVGAGCGCGGRQMRLRVEKLSDDEIREYLAASTDGKAAAICEAELAERAKDAAKLREDRRRRELQQQSGLLPGIRSFLNGHKEFGSPSKTQGMPDWAEGKRQRVQFRGGKDLLFYLKDGVVVTVYEDDARGERKQIWNSNLAELISRAEQGDASAQYDLASMYYYGKGVPQDYRKAFDWYSMAAPKS